MEGISSQEEDFLKSHGWYSHFVVVDDDRLVNYHTHGLPEHFGHPDFQVVLPVNSKTLHLLATKLVDRVKNGERFRAGMRVGGILREFDVFLIERFESQSVRRRVLRVILPDNTGNLDDDKLNGIFAAQFSEYPVQ